MHDIDDWLVLDLIDTNFKRWNEPLIRPTFTEEAAAKYQKALGTCSNPS